MRGILKGCVIKTGERIWCASGFIVKNRKSLSRKVTVIFPWPVQFLKGMFKKFYFKATRLGRASGSDKNFPTLKIAWEASTGSLFFFSRFEYTTSRGHLHCECAVHPCTVCTYVCVCVYGGNKLNVDFCTVNTWVTTIRLPVSAIWATSVSKEGFQGSTLLFAR